MYRIQLVDEEKKISFSEEMDSLEKALDEAMYRLRDEHDKTYAEIISGQVLYRLGMRPIQLRTRNVKWWRMGFLFKKQPLFQEKILLVKLEVLC